MRCKAREARLIMAYRPQNRTDRAKAMTAAIAVTALLGIGVITGLNVDNVSHTVERLRTFEISLPKPPPPPPPPKPRPRPAQKPQGATAAPKASPIVAPKPVVQLPTTQPVAAAPQPGTGASSANGQGGAGNGTGAGGTGNGLGGGGGGGNTPARLIRNLTRADYRALTGGRMRSGSAGLAIRINAAGRVDSCHVEVSSGDPGIDAGLCPLVQARLAFDPARNVEGRPTAVFTHYRAIWR
jgi:protein TonB